MNVLGRYLARALLKPQRHFTSAVSGGDPAQWIDWVEPGDVLLVEGRTRISSVIKYLTQSTWSHACLVTGRPAPEGPLIEAELDRGVIASPYAKYRDLNVRICRPLGLLDEERLRLIELAVERIGIEYDLRNLFDLARYFLPVPFPAHRRRQMLTFGSGEPTRAICSSMIAEAFASIRYPILPIPWWESNDPRHRRIIYQIRRYSSYTPRDFDLSPYFEVVKPMIERGYDFHAMAWRRDQDGVPEETPAAHTGASAAS